MHPTFSGTRLAGFYFAFQALALGAWWGLLAVDPAAEALFLPPGAARPELVAFRLPDLLVALPASLLAAVAILAGRRWAPLPAWVAAGALDYAFLYCVGWSLLREGGWLNVVLMAPAALLATVGALDASPALVEIFRRATPATPAAHVLATLGQTALFWSFFLFVVPAAIRYVERQLGLPTFTFPSQHVVAGASFLFLSALGLASGFAMAARGLGTPLPFSAANRLVVSGPYAHLRNPMVVSGLGQGVSVAVWTGSWTTLGYVLLGGLLWNALVRPSEERDLETVFGGEFLAYRAAVSCWIPRLRPYRSPPAEIEPPSG